MTTITDLQLLTSDLKDSALPIVAGCVTFGATLALSTAAQKMVGVSTATKVLPTVYGAATVCAASLMSEKSAILAHQWQYNPQKLQKDFQNIKANLWATSSNGLRRHHSSRTKPNFLDDEQDNARQLRRQNSKKSQWLQVHNLPMHEVRMCVVKYHVRVLIFCFNESAFSHIVSFNSTAACWAFWHSKPWEADFGPLVPLPIHTWDPLPGGPFRAPRRMRHPINGP